MKSNSQTKMRILVGLSGGLDSAYVARLLIEEGHSVEGAVLKMHEYTECSEAISVAKSLGIPCHIIDCTDAFDTVKEYFVNEYSQGRTPNPCVLCNREVKFKYLYQYAKTHCFDKIATGHYAKVVRIRDGEEERFAIAEATDLSKDQSYMLYGLSQDVLSMLLLPLSSLTKKEIRERAREAGMSVASSKESLDICFLPDRSYIDYVEEKRGVFPEGNFIDSNGNILGRHKGIIRYTVGQRKGLGIALGDRAFVTDINPINNTVTLSKESTVADTFAVSELIFSGMPRPTEYPVSLKLSVKPRYRSTPVKATCVLNSDGTATVRPEISVKLPAKGQSAVFYNDGVVLFGGIIS